MYTVDDVVYAGNPEPILKVTGVKVLDGYNLLVRFNDGQSKVFDCRSLLDEEVFQPLKDIEVFKTVYIDYGVLTWCDGDIDISPDYVYKHGTDVAEVTEHVG